MKCNYKPPKLTKEERLELTASTKSTLPYIVRLQIKNRYPEEMIIEEDEDRNGTET